MYVCAVISINAAQDHTECADITVIYIPDKGLPA
jgi:hypothetical protein